MRKYRFKFTTTEGVLLGYFLSIGSKLVSQQEAKVFSSDEKIIYHNATQVYDKFIWIYDDSIPGLEHLKKELKSQFTGITLNDICLEIERI